MGSVHLIARSAFTTGLFRLRWTNTTANWSTLADLDGGYIAEDFRVTLAFDSDGTQVLSAAAGAPVDVTRCEWELDGVPWRENDLGPPYTILAPVAHLFAVADLTPGPHTMTCRVVYIDNGVEEITETMAASFTTSGASGGASITPDPIAVAVSVPGPVVSGSGGVTITPAPVTVTAAVPPPAVADDEFIAGTLSPTNTGFVGAVNAGLTGAVTGYDDLTASGSITTSGPGQVIEYMDVSGQINVNHDDVTIRYCRVHQASRTAKNLILPASGVTGLTVEWCELYAGSGTDGTKAQGISGQYVASGGLAYRLYVYNTEDFGKGGAWTFRECLWDMVAQYPEAHNDGLQTRKVPAYGFIVEDCKFVQILGNANLFLNDSAGDVAGDVIFRRNWLQASDNAKCVLVEQKSTGWGPTALTITDNRLVQGWNNGPQSAITVKAPVIAAVATYTRSGNRYVDVNGNDLGSAD